MFETVSVDEALKRGKRGVTLPSLLIIIILLFSSVFLAVKFRGYEGWIISIGLLCSFISGWVYWGFAVTRWRLWAFENVRNVHELKKRAIKAQLIYKDGSFFEKTEIRSAADKAKWTELQEKFRSDDVFNEDHTISDETLVYYSKTAASIQMVVGLGFLGGAIYLLPWSANILIAVLLLAGGTYLFVSGLMHYMNRKPQIILTNEGVATAKINFYSWGEVTNEDTKIERHGKSRTVYFVYNYPGGLCKMRIGELAISQDELEKLLRMYRVGMRIEGIIKPPPLTSVCD